MIDPLLEVAAKLQSEGFSRAGPVAAALSEPIADTPMRITLDELRPYELNPRIARNPLYEEIKNSIRERGLDAPPPITRRPGADHYIIRNGGNTRLAILRELWAETKDERFYRLSCLFRPWSGEVAALTGHLAENELHGGLTFIERALGVEKARELYEQEGGKPLSQAELARRLKANGYPVPQPHISRMQEAIEYLLPAIPNVLYGGLGRPQIEQLTSLRRAAARTWEAHADKAQMDEFPVLFQDVLAGFDGNAGDFSLPRVQDELIGQMSDRLGMVYDTLAAEILFAEKRHQLLTSPPSSLEAPQTAPMPSTSAQTTPTPLSSVSPGRPAPDANKPDDGMKVERAEDNDESWQMASPVDTTERLQSIQQMVSDQIDEPPPDTGKSFPIQVESLYPITDIWRIDPGLDTPECLRVHIVQFAREIAHEAEIEAQIMPHEQGIGFVCLPQPERVSDFARAALALLQSLAATPSELLNTGLRVCWFPFLLIGEFTEQTASSLHRLSDDGLIKLFRLMRLARRLRDIEADAADDLLEP
jgi:ParB family protein of integrating conjugative element (PFGI_1 class)